MRRQSSSSVPSLEVDRQLDGTAYDNVKLVADNIIPVNAVGGNITDVIAVGAIDTEIVTLEGIKAEILSLYADKLTLDSLYADKIPLDSIYADKATLDSLYADKLTLDSLLADKATLDSLFADKATLDSLFADKIILDSLYADKTAIDAVYAAIANIDIVAPHVANIDIVAPAVTSGAVGTVADDIVGVNAYYNTYLGPLATPPTLKNDGVTAVTVGDMYFDTTADFMKIYSAGLTWDAVGSSVNGTTQRTPLIATGGETVIAHTYDVGYVDVIVNGDILYPTEYTASNGTSIVLNEPLVADDAFLAIGYGTFTLADHYTKIESDILHRSVPMRAKATEILARGDIVSATGYNLGQDAIEIAKTVGQTDIAVGIVDLTLGTGDFGNIITRGLIEGLNTSAYAFGDILYSNGAGGLTNIKPTGVYQAVGYVVKDNASTGAIMVNFTEPVDSYSKTEIDNKVDATLTPSKALASDVNGKVVASVTTDVELNYVAGATSNIQTQINSISPIGVGQTWQNVTVSRSIGTIYTNSTSKAIMVSASLESSNSGIIQLKVAGVITAQLQVTGALEGNLSVIVPVGTTYQLLTVSGSHVLRQFAELR